jgi:hypothetical protein
MKTVFFMAAVFGNCLLAQAEHLESKLPSSVASSTMQRLVSGLKEYNDSAEQLGNRKATLSSSDGVTTLAFPLSGDTRTKGQMLCTRGDGGDAICTVQDYADNEPLRNNQGDVRNYGSLGDFAASELFALLPVEAEGNPATGMSKSFENIKCQVSRWSIAACQVHGAALVAN